MKFQLLVVFAGLCLLVSSARAQAGAPTIASLSNSQTVTEGQNITLSVSVNGTSPFSYQWRKGSTPISGATGSSLAFAPIRASDVGTYYVVVTNSVSSVTSGPVILAVKPAVAPTLSYQMSSPRNFIVGDTLSLSASFDGTEPMTFVWKRGTTTLGTTTSSYYSKANVQASDAGSYTVTATNIAGSATSNAVTVTVSALSPPSISGLSDVTVETGGSLWLWPYINGSGTITYQWKKDGVAISGATYYHLSKSNLQASDAGNYTLTATNSAGSTTSSPAKVTILPPVAPSINSVSGPVSVAAGDSFSISVYASGTATLTYQWRKDGVNIAGATSGYYSKSNAQASDAGDYTVVVSNAQGAAVSDAVPVAITTAKPPIITYHPASFAVRQGEYLYSISVGVIGTGSLAYQWSKDGVPISGATSSSLYFGHTITAADVGAYTVVVSSSQGSATSEPCRIAMLPATPPVITHHPAGRTLRQGESISLSVYAYGSPEPTYQWRKDGVALSGQTYPSYYKGNAVASDAGSYSLVATNSAGSATSDSATITIVPVSAPQFVVHPASASLLPGEYFHGLYVEVRSMSGTTLQWYRNGTAIPGANGNHYYISNAQPSVAGTYTVTATNAAGSVTSHEGVITVEATRPVITYVPGSRAIAGGNSANVSISTSSSGESLQWFKDGQLIPNATDKTYSFNNFGLGSVGTYTAQVTNTSGTFTSRPIVLALLDSGMAPLITYQPTGKRPKAGQSAEFSVLAEGEAPLTYQWRKDGVNLAGAVASSLYVSNVSAANAGNYSVVVSNRNGSATSSAAALTLTPTSIVAPVITSHPASQTLTTGSGYLNLAVSVADPTGVTYQWRKNGTAIAGATGESYWLHSITTATAGSYSVVVTNSAGNATSYDAIVGVTSNVTGPTFTVQPKSQTAYYGTSVTLTATATSTSTITYRWRKNGTAISGATTSSLTLSNLQSSDAATYTLLATDANGSTPSASATLTVTGGVTPFIITAPQSVTALAATNVTFTGAAGGTPEPTLQWQKNGIDIPGATKASLVLSKVQLSDAGNYAVVARNAVGNVTSPAATLQLIYPPPSITTQPVPVSVQPGGNATFSVVVPQVPPPAYQWRKDGVNIAGATSSSLTLTNVSTAHAGRYSVVVQTDFGSVTSVDALLTVGNPITVVPPSSVTVRVGENAILSASVSSIDPLVFAWAKNGAFIPGATTTQLVLTNVQIGDAGVYVLVISRPDGTVVYPLTGSAALAATVTVLPSLGPTFLQHPADANVTLGSSLTLSAKAQGSGSIAYQWKKDGQLIAGANQDDFTIASVQPSDAGDYTVTATDVNGSTVSNVGRVTIAQSAFAGTYSGTFPNGDTWALHVGSDGRAVFLALLSGRNQAIVARDIIVLPSGAFSFGHAASTAASGAPSYSAHYFSGIVHGNIQSFGGVTGNIPGANLPLLGARVAAAPNTAPAGHVQAVPLAGGLGQIDAIVSPDGSVFVIAADAAGVRGGRSTVATDGSFAISQAGFAFAGSLAADQGKMQGTYSTSSGGAVVFGTPAASNGVERLVNVATRGFAGSDMRTLTAGFVISGSGTKEVLIRAVGPALAEFGVTGLLPNPRLRIFRDGKPVIENDDWALGGFSTQIADAAVRVGAFALPAGSADSAVLVRLEPGAYTAQVGVDSDAAGVALIEVYDAHASSVSGPKLVNLSTRGDVGRGGDILIVGVVVSGTAAKRLLIRGIGPALERFNVTGVLADPRLQLYRGTVLLRENDNWSDQADAAAVASAATSVAAFPLPDGSKDAALLVYLQPGNYTAQVSGVADGTGVALVEVYEVP